VFRSWVRKTWVQKLFLSLPLGWRRSITNHLRSNSHAQYQHKTKSSQPQNLMKMNVTLEACAATLRSHTGDKLIHGHTHLPAHHVEQLGEQSWQRWVLSDWDLDHPEAGNPRANTLLINDQGEHFIDLVKS